jgi:transcriptional regulator with XRE-family HTH domain
MLAFAALVTARRFELGMTRTQLACRVGVAPSQVARWEDGGGMPRDATLVLLGAVLGYNPARLWALANGVAI